MERNKRICFVLVKCIIIVITGFFTSSCSDNTAKEFKLTPKQTLSSVKTKKTSDKNFEVGVGWAKGKEDLAIRQALALALKDKSQKSPDLLIIHPTAGTDCGKILRTARSIVGNKTKIYGGTSDARGVLSSLRYVEGTKGGYETAKREFEGDSYALALMTISTPDIDFGVGSASLDDYDSPEQMGEAAIQAAIQNSGQKITSKPTLILVTPSIGIEQRVLNGISNVVGPDIILLGGTVGGPHGVVIGNEKTYQKGVSLAVFYTDLPVGWAFESGFEKPDEYSGIVTKMDGRRIIEIDNEPSYEVYDRWLGGELSRLRQKGEKADIIRDFLSLHPLFRKRQSPDGKTYTVFSHPWAPNKKQITAGLFPTGDIQVGDRVYLSYGTWEILMNRIGSLPFDARNSMNFDKNGRILLGIGNICGGALGVIPEEERKKLSVLLNHANNNLPFIAPVTWGEQGVLPGVGYQHCNLTTSFLVIGSKD